MESSNMGCDGRGALAGVCLVTSPQLVLCSSPSVCAQSEAPSTSEVVSRSRERRTCRIPPVHTQMVLKPYSQVYCERERWRRRLSLPPPPCYVSTDSRQSPCVTLYSYSCVYPLLIGLILVSLEGTVISNLQM